MGVEGQASRHRQVGNGDDDHASQVMYERQAIVEGKRDCLLLPSPS